MSTPLLGATEALLRRDRTSVKWVAYPPDVLPLWVAEMDAAPCPAVAEAVSAVAVASTTALSQIGVQIGPLLAGAGVVGIAVGFGAQTLVKDFLTGVFLLIGVALMVLVIYRPQGILGNKKELSFHV